MTTPTWTQLLGTLLSGQDLSAADTAWAMREVIAGDAADTELAGFLVALEVGELDCLEAVVQAAKADGGGAHQASPAVAGAGDPA